MFSTLAALYTATGNGAYSVGVTRSLAGAYHQEVNRLAALLDVKILGTSLLNTDDPVEIRKA